MPARTKAYLYLILVVCIWAIGGPVIKYALSFTTPEIALTFRFAISSLILIPYLHLVHPKSFQTFKKLSSSQKSKLIIAGFFGTTAQLGLLFLGFSKTTSIDGTLINATASIWVAIFAHIFLKDKITKVEKIGLFISFVGSVLIIIKPAIENQTLFSGSLIGNFLVFLATLTWVVYAILSKKLLRQNITHQLLATSSVLVGFLTILPFFMISNSLSTIPNIPFTGWLAIIYMGIFSGAIAYFIYQKAQRSIETSEADVFLYLVPVFSTPISFFWLKEPITNMFILGSIIICVGVFISEFKRKKKKHS